MTEYQSHPTRPAITPVAQGQQLIQIGDRTFLVSELPTHPAPQPAIPTTQPPQHLSPTLPPDPLIQHHRPLGILLWVACGGLGFALGVALLRALLLPVPAQSSLSADHAAYVESLRQQNAQLQRDVGRLEGQNSEVQQQLQAQPKYEEHCRPGGFLWLQQECVEYRR